MSFDFLNHAGEPNTRVKAFYLALKNYHLAHRVWTYADDARMQFAFADDIIAGEQMPFKRMRAEEFDDPKERKITAEQIAGNQFGLCFIAMFDLLETIVGIGKVPTKAPPELIDISILIWAVRNAFAHKIGTPVWNVQDPKFCRELMIGSRRIDLTQLQGLPVHPDQLGGALSVERVWNALNEDLNRYRGTVNETSPSK